MSQASLPQPAASLPQEDPLPNSSQWTTGLFGWPKKDEDKDDEKEGMLVVTACPAIMYGRLAKQLRNDSTTPACLLYLFCWLYFGWLFAGSLRTRLRKKYGLPEEPRSDCAVHCLYSPCAVWQEYREIQYREGLQNTSSEQ